VIHTESSPSIPGALLGSQSPEGERQCTIYEKRPEGLTQGGSITLFPNSLRILDSLGVNSTIHMQGFDMTTATIKDSSFKTLKTLQLSDPQRFGYPALRIRRDAIVGTLTAAARSLDVPINYGYKLIDIVEDTPNIVCVSILKWRREIRFPCDRGRWPSVWRPGCQFSKGRSSCLYRTSRPHVVGSTLQTELSSQLRFGRRFGIFPDDDNARSCPFRSRFCGWS
jgi:hypothetical protein